MPTSATSAITTAAEPTTTPKRTEPISLKPHSRSKRRDFLAPLSETERKWVKELLEAVSTLRDQKQILSPSEANAILAATRTFIETVRPDFNTAAEKTDAPPTDDPHPTITRTLAMLVFGLIGAAVGFTVGLIIGGAIGGSVGNVVGAVFGAGLGSMAGAIKGFGVAVLISTFVTTTVTSVIAAMGGWFLPSLFKEKPTATPLEAAKQALRSAVPQNREGLQTLHDIVKVVITSIRPPKAAPPPPSSEASLSPS